MTCNEVQEAVNSLIAGDIICLPTDTLYALSCDATNFKAIKNLYCLKKRPLDKKLPVLFDTLESVMQYCYMPDLAIKLANKWWPGKLTMVLQLKPNSNITEYNIAVRIPNNDFICSIIKVFGKPIIGTSANISGYDNCMSQNDVHKHFKDVRCFQLNNYQPNIQSTIIAFEGDKYIILREGAILTSELL